MYTPEEVGPLSFQVPNGTVDIVVADEAEATAVAKKYLSYFQGPVKDWEQHDQRKLRHIVPESRTQIYDMREPGAPCRPWAIAATCATSTRPARTSPTARTRASATSSPAG